MSDNKEREELDYAIRTVMAEKKVDYWPLYELISAIQESVLAAGFRRAPIEVTDEAVEAGARALYSASWEVLGAFSGEDPCTWQEFKDKDFFRTDSRIVLEALAKGGTE